MRGRGGRDCGDRSETGIGRIRVDRGGGVDGTAEVARLVVERMVEGRGICRESTRSEEMVVMDGEEGIVVDRRTAGLRVCAALDSEMETKAGVKQCRRGHIDK